jgi:hypothetical protein
VEREFGAREGRESEAGRLGRTILKGGDVITVYEQIKRADKGAVLYLSCRASNATAAAARCKRKVKTEQVVVATKGDLSVLDHGVIRVTVLK